MIAISRDELADVMTMSRDEMAGLQNKMGRGYEIGEVMATI